MSPNAWAMTGLVLCFAITVALNLVLALSPEPEVADGSYPLFVPSDGANGLRTLFQTSFVFQAGALFAFSAQARKTGWFILAFGLFFAMEHGGDVMREPLAAAIVVVVGLAIDGIWVRAGWAPKWWLWLRAGVALPLFTSAVMIVALT